MARGLVERQQALLRCGDELVEDFRAVLRESRGVAGEVRRKNNFGLESSAVGKCAVAQANIAIDQNAMLLARC